MHSALDDRTRIVYSEIHPNEQAVTAVGFWERANAFFNTLGITVERVITDDGPCYRSTLWRTTLEELGTTAKFTRPYRPQTNGKLNVSTESSDGHTDLNAQGQPPRSSQSDGTI